VRRDGLYAYYRLRDQGIASLWQALRSVGETHLAEIDSLVRTYLHQRDTLDPMPLDELRRRLASESVVLIDVRPGIEYQAGHIPGARSIPIDQLELRLEELPGDQTIVAYCRGPYCVFADEAVALLAERGYTAYRLEVGVPEWRTTGNLVAS
jgi:rhodanese-related sulfurtransferase